MSIPVLLILMPLVAAGVLFFTRHEALRKTVVTISVATVCVLSVLLACAPSPIRDSLPANPENISRVLFGVELGMSLFLIYIGIRAKNALAIALVLLQTGLMFWYEHASKGNGHVQQPLLIDNFAVIMALINGVVGGGICIYALGYMREYHEKAHVEILDRRPLFFGLLFTFMGAMFGLVFANDLTWLFLFWEVTTLCSFLLIGYTQTEQARKNALRALIINLLGGVAFAGAIVWCQKQVGTVDLQVLLRSDHALVLAPAALLCFAGITKSAQLPFSSWLLGAMVAPTPVSALLHSSTMVKAGVYLVLRMAPVIVGTRIGMLVGLVGGVTFVIGSLAAITTSDAKKVLAWSTVANLGLIVLCGGIGTAEALWAGILLIIFHAVAKCLLFLCVGVVEHKLHSRDIESMSGLVVAMPKVAVMMLIGMAGMFLAPFGMLISKWAVLKAVVDSNPMLSVFIVFGSSATLFFWVKWMGKLLEVVTPPHRIEAELTSGQAVALGGLSVATFLACLMFPLISRHYIMPFVTGIYGEFTALDKGNVLIMISMMALILLFPVSYINYGKGVRVTDAYLGGANVQSSVRFRSSADSVETVTIGNYYLANTFNEATLSRWGVIGAGVLLATMLILAFV